MEFSIADKGDYLRADLLTRESAADTEEFLKVVREATLSHPSARLLIVVHSPRTTFRVEKFRASQFLDELAANPKYRVALVALHFEARLVQQYVEALARFKGANLRSFGHELMAVRWLTRSDALDTEAASETPGTS